jgi:hypothetical protein
MMGGPDGDEFGEKRTAGCGPGRQPPPPPQRVSASTAAAPAAASSRATGPPALGRRLRREPQASSTCHGHTRRRLPSRKPASAAWVGAREAPQPAAEQPGEREQADAGAERERGEDPQVAARDRAEDGLVLAEQHQQEGARHARQHQGADADGAGQHQEREARGRGDRREAHQHVAAAAAAEQRERLRAAPAADLARDDDDRGGDQPQEQRVDLRSERVQGRLDDAGQAMTLNAMPTTRPSRKVPSTARQASRRRRARSARHTGGRVSAASAVSSRA